MKYRKLYTCDLCGKEFSEPWYSCEDMSTFNFKLFYSPDLHPGDSHKVKKLSIGKNGEEICLCPACTNKMKKALKELGFTKMYEKNSVETF